MLEKNIEARLMRVVKKSGWRAPKLTARGQRSWTDRLILPGNGRVVFCELKRPGGEPTPGQADIHQWLRENGYEVVVKDSIEDVDEMCMLLMEGAAL